MHLEMRIDGEYGLPYSTAMRFLVVVALTLSAVQGQSDVSKLLSQGLSGALAAFEPVAEVDKKAILTSAAVVLAKHVTFRPDGTAAAVCTKLGKQHVEWKRLVVRNITKQAVTDADRLNGITRRFQVSFGCDGHRTFDSKTNRWTEWMNIGYVAFSSRDRIRMEERHVDIEVRKFERFLFPAGIEFEWKNGTWTLKSESLKGFSPGPGPSITDQNRAAKDAGLPPGMKRGN
jgi:hypothetical protein